MGRLRTAEVKTLSRHDLGPLISSLKLLVSGDTGTLKHRDSIWRAQKEGHAETSEETTVRLVTNNLLLFAKSVEKGSAIARGSVVTELKKLGQKYGMMDSLVQELEDPVTAEGLAEVIKALSMLFNK